MNFIMKDHITADERLTFKVNPFKRMKQRLKLSKKIAGNTGNLKKDVARFIGIIHQH